MKSKYTHLFIFVGPPMSGKTTLSNLIGKDLFYGKETIYHDEGEEMHAIKDYDSMITIIERYDDPTPESLARYKKKYKFVTVCRFEAVN